jgi:Bacterial Ig domain/Bacterial Ig-like domain (group 3)/PA domain
MARRPVVLAALLTLFMLSAVTSAQAAPAVWQATVTLGNGSSYTGAGKDGAVPTSPLFDGGSCAPGSLDPAHVAGKIIVCDDGAVTFAQKSQEVRDAGGVGAIITNSAPGPVAALDGAAIQTINVNDVDGAAIRAYMAGTPNAVASFGAGHRVFAASTTTLASSANPSTVGQLVTFTASVSAGSLQPTGTVAFTDGGTPIAGCQLVTLTSAAQASCSVSTLGAGAHSIQAAYSGDNGLNPSSATLSQQVNAPQANRAPKTKPDVYFTSRNHALTIAAPGVLRNDSDPDGDALTVTRVLGPAFGTLTLNANGSFTYTPRKNFSGIDGFVYRVSDGRGGTALGVVAITVFR